MTVEVILEDESLHKNNDTILEATCDFGLWISWQGGYAKMEFMLDEAQHDLHPHIHTPHITNTMIVKGGGSGATVFSGTLSNNKLIWKHGDYKDMRDVFALAEIEHELLQRSEYAPTDAENLRMRIPRFAGVFISPAAFRVRPGELWDSLRKTILLWNNPLGEANDGSVEAGSSEFGALHNGLPRPVSHQNLSGELYHSIKVFKGDETDIDVLRREVRMYLDKCTGGGEEREAFCDYETTKRLVEVLARLQAKYVWKLSVAQMAIGGDMPRTASSLLTSGELQGAMLNDMLDQFIGVLRSLRAVTSPKEKEAIEQVREEVRHLPEDATGADISRLADSFVGSAIIKNWHPERGRYAIARELGAQMRKGGNLVLTPEERIPADALGTLFIDFKSHIKDVYELDHPDDTSFIHMPRVWRNLLENATQVKSKAATECIWTCGLTDAGLHNMFFSDGRLWLFDLGEPNCQPLPAFLTKFLMSFFHCLGMQETPDGGNWVRRFKEPQEGEKLELTDETKEMLVICHESYQVALDRLVEELFDGEEAVKELMIKYTILQLLSDSAFCLRKWQIKGGGSPSYGDGNHNVALEKWLWRSLWDIWVASDVSMTYLSNFSQQ